jgi:hypothetical protein
VTQTENVDVLAQEARRAKEDGRLDDALQALEQAFELAVSDERAEHTREFIPLLEWEWLAQAYPPARDALVRVRDRQARLMLEGQLTYGGAPAAWPHPKTRFSLVARLNRALGDPQSTYDLFAQLDAARPDYAARVSIFALEEVVGAGDFALGERYARDPVERLEQINEAARILPMFPPPGEAPQLSAELGNFAKDLRLQSAILRGLDREAEALALMERAIGGLETADARDWVVRELDTPGSIRKAIVAHHMAQDEEHARLNRTDQGS